MKDSRGGNGSAGSTPQQQGEVPVFDKAVSEKDGPVKLRKPLFTLPLLPGFRFRDHVIPAIWFAAGYVWAYCVIVLIPWVLQ